MRRLVAARGVTAAIAIGVLAAVAVLLFYTHRRGSEPVAPGGPATMRLISTSQYIAAIHDIFGEDIAVDVSFAPPQRDHGLLALGASMAAVTPGGLEQFERAARDVAKQVTDDRHRDLLVGCAPSSPNDVNACASQFFTRVGRLLYRRPLTPAELKTEVDVTAATARQLGGFYSGIAYALAGMLTSPKFLYFIENAEPDPDEANRLRLDGYARATRLSLFLWNAPPDEALLDAAERGDLYKESGLARQIDRMLASPRLAQGVRTFFSDLLTFEKFETLAKDPAIYPDFTAGIARATKEQMLQVITDELLTRNADYRDLFTTRHTWINGELGAFYKAPVATPNGWVSYDTDPQASAGLLTSPGFLALYSHPGKSSPTRRGRAIRELLLCEKVPDPPPNVTFEIFNDPNQKFATARQRLEAHRSNPVCAGCHRITDPIGLALENFDGAGQYREAENGTPIDASGELNGTSFANVEDLGKAMRADPALTSCLVTRLYSYGVGRPTTPRDATWLGYVTKNFAADGFRFRDLLREMTTSPAFYAVLPPAGRNEALGETDSRTGEHT